MCPDLVACKPADVTALLYHPKQASLMAFEVALSICGLGMRLSLATSSPHLDLAGFNEAYNYMDIKAHNFNLLTISLHCILNMVSNRSSCYYWLA